MRFLADENVPGPVVAVLRGRGHDVFWAKESLPGADDAVILEIAQRGQRAVGSGDSGRVTPEILATSTS